MENKKLHFKIGVMSKEEQTRILTPFLKQRKFQVEIELLGKRKYAYCDDLSELDDFVKRLDAKIIEVKEIKKDGN